MYSSATGPPRQFIHPRGYEARYSEYLVEPPHQWSRAADTDSYVKMVEEFLEKRLNIYYDLLEKEDYSLFVIVFSELDWLMHRIPDIVEGRQMHRIYRIASMIDRFVRKASGECSLLILASDHGFRVARVLVGVNSILADRGLIDYRYHVARGAEHSATEPGSGSSPSSARGSRIRPLLRLARRLIPRSLLKRIRPLIPLQVEVNYSTSRAFMLETGNLGVYVRRGYCGAVRQALQGISQIRGIASRDEVFWGPYVERAPSLLLIPGPDVFFDANIHAEPLHKGIWASTSSTR